jgi:MFS family permease
LTALVVAYERSLHFDLATTGWVATAEGVGYTIGALVAALLSRHLRATMTRVVAIILVLAAAQFASTCMTSAMPLAACRVLSGIGAGLLYAIGIPSIAASRHPDRGFAIYFGANFASGLVAMVVIPPLLTGLGLKGFYVVYGTALVLCTALVRWYPLVRSEVAAGTTANATATATATAAAAPTAAYRTADTGPVAVECGSLIASLFVNFIFNGGLWVLAEHFGLEIPGTNAESLGELLAGTMLFGVLGSVLATALAQRWSHFAVIVVSNAALILAALIMVQWHTLAGLILAMALLNMAVTLLTPASLAALAALSAPSVQWGNLATQAGYCIGPAAVAAIGARSGLNGLVPISIGAFIASAALAWAGLKKRSTRAVQPRAVAGSEL